MIHKSIHNTVWGGNAYDCFWTNVIMCAKKTTTTRICMYLWFPNKQTQKQNKTTHTQKKTLKGIVLQKMTFTNQSDETNETTPSRTSVINSLFHVSVPSWPAGRSPPEVWLQCNPPQHTHTHTHTHLGQLEIAGPSLLLCSARWTPTGKLWVSTAACHTEQSGQWFNPLWDLLLTH